MLPVCAHLVWSSAGGVLNSMDPDELIVTPCLLATLHSFGTQVDIFFLSDRSLFTTVVLFLLNWLQLPAD